MRKVDQSARVGIALMSGMEPVSNEIKSLTEGDTIEVMRSA